eukprot:m51a1_g14761 putative e3 ubiquitin-protein ligase rififylin (388) ;mRNA; r:343926-345757
MVDAVHQAPHSWDLHKVRGLSATCAQCNKVLWGLHKAYRCKYCGSVVHQKCILAMPSTCPFAITVESPSPVTSPRPSESLRTSGGAPCHRLGFLRSCSAGSGNVAAPHARALSSASPQGSPRGREMMMRWAFAGDSQHTELALPAGTHVLLVEVVRDWAYVRTMDGATSGYVPHAFLGPPIAGPVPTLAPLNPATPDVEQQQQQQQAEPSGPPSVVHMRWVAQAEEELSVEEGERVVVVSKDSESEGWVKCRTAAGKTGLLPVICLKEQDHPQHQASSQQLRDASGRPRRRTSPKPERPRTRTAPQPEHPRLVVQPREEDAAENEDVGDGVPNVPEDSCCKICMERQMDVIILWCGHVAICSECGKELKQCPICRQPIFKLQRFYKA